MTWLRVPDPLTLLVGCVLVAAALSHVLPPGEYQRQTNPATGREVVVAGTYAPVGPSPVGFFDAIVAIPRGMADAADVVFLILFGSAAFAVVDRTGALATGVAWLVHLFGRRELLVIPLVSVLFAAGGVLENMQEEIIALAPVLLLLTGRLGFSPMTAVAMSIGSAFVGSSFSPINPFQVVIAQRVADVPQLSGWELRTAFLVPAVAIWILWTMRHAAATRQPGTSSPADRASELPAPSELRRHLLVLAIVGVTFGVIVWGLLFRGWDFNALTAVFFLMGVAAGLVGRLGLSGTAQAFTQGFREMAFAAVVVGLARAIFIVLSDGRIVDTIVHGLFTPIADLPAALAGLGMMGGHAVIHLAVPSVSGQAVLTMPIMGPLADLMGMPRQVAVLAYQYGAGMVDMITPTNGALMAVLATAGVRYDEWLRFALPGFLVLVGLGGTAVVVALAIGLQ
jgi:uncharacterized ion transporter superfamily protein YfcC